MSMVLLQSLKKEHCINRVVVPRVVGISSQTADFQGLQGWEMPMWCQSLCLVSGGTADVEPVLPGLLTTDQRTLFLPATKGQLRSI